ncbi:hypothetical protein EVAR_2827_1 [Eumeta japonica]|uniref:Uncharacterized protein n=1 Tax=Eumeta variegata TaxID=151549 RepID=A0A4C1SZN2_EUMVA|nr:hypothetical protein EVAR_2827_1 [Eumeta japonica]
MGHVGSKEQMLSSFGFRCQDYQTLNEKIVRTRYNYSRPCVKTATQRAATRRQKFSRVLFCRARGGEDINLTRQPGPGAPLRQPGAPSSSFVCARRNGPGPRLTYFRGVPPRVDAGRAK